MSDTISIVSERKEDDVPVRLGAFPSDQARKLVDEQVKAEEIRESISEICNKLRPEAIDPEETLGIEEVELSFVISAQSGIRLIGEVNAGVQASIKVKIKRK